MNGIVEDVSLDGSVGVEDTDEEDDVDGSVDDCSLERIGSEDSTGGRVPEKTHGLYSYGFPFTPAQTVPGAHGLNPLNSFEH